MLSKPDVGWTTLQIDDYEFSASYLTDIPNDCIDAFVYGLKNNKPVTIYFDGEGVECYLVCDYYCSYVIDIDCEDKERIIRFDKGIKELAKECINDIEKYYNEWIYWKSYNEEPINVDFTELKKLLI